MVHGVCYGWGSGSSTGSTPPGQQNPSQTGGQPQNQQQQGGQQPNGQQQNQSAQQPGASTATPAGSVEGTVLSYNALQAAAKDVVGRITVPTDVSLFVMSQTEALTILAPDLVTAQVKLLVDSGKAIDKQLQDDLSDTPPAHTGPFAQSFPGGTEIITNVAAIASMVEQGLPTTTDTFNNVSADSDTLVYLVANQLTSAKAYLPAFFPPPVEATPGSIAAVTKDLSTMQVRIQADLASLSGKKPQTPAPGGSPPPAPPAGAFTWYPQYDTDVQAAQTWVTGYTSFITVAGTPDSTGTSPMARAFANAYIRQMLVNNPGKTQILVLRAETTTGATRNDKGFFGKWWLIPQPHNDYYYGGVAVADFALFSGDGRLIGSGVVKKAIAHLAEKDFDATFGASGSKTWVQGDQQN
jgi:hypothetical protein